MSRKIDLLKKERILESAKILFSKHDYKDITIGQIAKNSSIGKGTVYLYFKNKDEIFFEIIEKSSIQIYSRIQDIIKKETDFYKALDTVVKSMINFFIENIEHFKIMQKGEIDLENTDRTELRNKMIKRHTILLNEIAKIFKLKNSPKLKMVPEILAQYLMAAIMSSLKLFSCDQNIKVKNNPAENIIDMFLYGIIKK